VENDSERNAVLEIKLVKEPYTSHMTPTVAVRERGWSRGNPRARQVIDHYHNFEIERENERRALAEQARQQRVIQKQNEQRDRQVLTAIIVVVGICLLYALINGLGSLRHKWISSGGSSGNYSYSSGSSDSEKPQSGSNEGSPYVGDNFGSIGRGNVTKTESNWPSKSSASIHERSSGIGPGVDHHGIVTKQDRQGPKEIQTGHGWGKETWSRQKDGSFERKK